MSQILLLIGRDRGFDGWLRLSAGEIERGTDPNDFELDSNDRIVAIAPGESVALHWLELDEGLTQAQAAAAARLLLAEASAHPISEMHVAVGRPVEEEPGRCIGMVPIATMTEWLDRLSAIGAEAAAIVPEPLLMPIPDAGLVRLDRSGLSLFRGPSEAFAIEPDTAHLLLAGRPVVDIDSTLFDAGLEALTEDPLLDLRQGAFARRRRLRFDPTLVRRLVALGALLLLVSLAIQVAAIMRYTFGADALEAETRRVAAAALPRSPGVTNASSELADRLRTLRGAGVGYAATSSAVFAAIRATPNVELNGLSFSPDGSLRATIAADDAASLDRVVAQVEASGFATQFGPPRNGGGRRVADLIVRPS